MSVRDTHKGAPDNESEGGAGSRSAERLTEGQRKTMKMVTPYIPSRIEHMKDMMGMVRLAGEMAYHFGNILTVTSGYGDILRMKMPKGDPSIAYVEKILDSSRRAHDMVRGLLMFAGNEKVRLREVELNRVLKRSIRFVPGDVGDLVQTRTEFNESELFVMADVGMLEEVFKSLIENALEAMPEGGVLTLHTGHAPTGGQAADVDNGKEALCALITIADTGVGMDRETKQRMFDPFFSTKGQRRNMGLGLSKVYGIVKQHSGDIAVESSLGKGTTVKVRMPATRVGAKTAGPIPLPFTFAPAQLRVPGSYMGD